MNMIVCACLCVCVCACLHAPVCVRACLCVCKGAENESKYNVYLPCDCRVLNLNCILSLKFNCMTLLNTFVDCWKRL